MTDVTVIQPTPEPSPEPVDPTPAVEAAAESATEIAATQAEATVAVAAIEAERDVSIAEIHAFSEDQMGWLETELSGLRTMILDTQARIVLLETPPEPVTVIEAETTPAGETTTLTLQSTSPATVETLTEAIAESGEPEAAPEPNTGNRDRVGKRRILL